MGALAALGGGLVAGGGSLAGGLIASEGGLNSGDFIIPDYDPRADPFFQITRREVLSPLGFGDISRVPSYAEELAGRIRDLPLDEKSKRRALLELNDLVEGRPLTLNGEFLDAAINRLGLGQDEVQQRLDRDVQRQGVLDRISQSEAGGLQEDTIMARLRTAQQAAAQLEAAAGFAQSGEPVNDLQRRLLEIDNRTLERIRDQNLVNANFGNLSPGQSFQNIQDAELSQDLRLFQQAVGVSNALLGGLQGATASAQQTDTSNQNALASAAQILANQADARNSIRNQTSLDNAISLGNAVSGAGLLMGDASDRALGSLFGSSGGTPTPAQLGAAQGIPAQPAAIGGDPYFGPYRR